MSLSSMAWIRGDALWIDFLVIISNGLWWDRDFAFPDTHFVKALLAMLSALRLVAGSKHAPRAFGSATWQAGAPSDQGIHKTNQNARKVN